MRDGEFLGWFNSSGQAPAAFTGIDVCPDAIVRAREKHPTARFTCRDILADDTPTLPAPVDFVTINGVFTVRDTLDEPQMWTFLSDILARVRPVAGYGLAFNVMSDVVDWRRDDLFHVPMDRLARLVFDLTGARRSVFRSDYDLYEYTTYVFGDPVTSRRSVPGSPKSA